MVFLEAKDDAHDSKDVALMKSMFRLVFCGALLVLQGACYSDQTVLEKVSDQLDRCWEFVDTGDFPSRGLFWVRDTRYRTYHDGWGLKIEYTGRSLNNLHCTVSNWKAGWTEEEREEVLTFISQEAPEWVASRHDLLESQVSMFSILRNEQVTKVVFLPSAIERESAEVKGAFVEVYNDPIGGFFHVRVGNSIFIRY